MVSSSSVSEEIALRKARVAAIREEARRRFDSGFTGGQIATFLSESIDGLLRDLMAESICGWSPEPRDRAEQGGALVAVGGTGRGELAPYSDIDLLFLDGGGSRSEFRDAATRMVQICWDAKLDLGHSIRNVRDCIVLARQEAEIATGLVEARLLWGNADLFEQLRRQFRTRVVRSRLGAYLDDCVAARANEWKDAIPTALELQPDIKTSLGGLRDLHLLRWMGYGLCGQRGLESLRLHGLLDRDDARRLRRAREYLTRLRINLHFAAGREQDVLSRDEQLRIATEEGFEGTDVQTPVEQFMQIHFQHSSAIAEVSRDFVALYRRPTWRRRVTNMMGTHRSDGVLLVQPQEIDVRQRHLGVVCRDVESMLRLYRAAALYGKLPSPRVTKAMTAALPAHPPEELTREAAAHFLAILGCTESLGPTLRSMFDCRLLDQVIPDVSHIRCLLQFNQYHHYTVDEHTLRAMETVTQFAGLQSPIGGAYRRVAHKEVLHLALLLHDIGKGYEEDHCIVGRDIAARIAARLYLSEEQRDQVMLLVEKHLEMADLALRRDFTDERALVKFAGEIGTAEVLRMLYVLTAADITSVGPGVFTSWKAELLSELFDSAMVIISGRHYSYLEEERLKIVRQRMRESMATIARPDEEPSSNDWFDRQLDEFSPYYLTCTRPERIASDLDVIRHLQPQQIHVDGHYDHETDCVEYRIIMRDQPSSGCFHKATGVLTAKRMEILSADISTTTADVVVDRFRVQDHDFRGEVPASRLNEVSKVLTDVLTNEVSIETLFQRNTRFGEGHSNGPISDLPLRVRVDNETSATRTIIDVFAHDRPGLLYTIARTLYELELSVDLAKIGTHLDQVVDVFYVTDNAGKKLTDPDRIRAIRGTLWDQLAWFDREGYRSFVSDRS